MRIYDAFETRKQANDMAKQIREDNVQFVRVRKVSEGRLKYGVFVGGRNSGRW